MPNPEFHFTLNQMFVWIVSVCGGITGIAAAIAVMVKFNTFLKKPNHDQDVKIEDLTTRMAKMETKIEEMAADFKKQNDRHAELFQRDKDRLDAQENSMNMLLRANFALLGHALNGNNVEQMQSAFNDIQEYLFNR